MSKWMFVGSFSVVVEDEDQLPEGVEQQHVIDSLVAALQAAASEWHQQNRNLVRDEPVVGSP